MRPTLEPESQELSEFLNEFNKETDRGATLNAAAVLDDWLQKILESFFVDNKSGKDLISGFNAPLGTFSKGISSSCIWFNRRPRVSRDNLNTKDPK